MRVAVHWLLRQRLNAAEEHENLEELALQLLGADLDAARRRTERHLQIVAEAGGEVAS